MTSTAIQERTQEIKARVDAICAGYPAEQSSLVQVLQDVHKEFNYLPAEALERVAIKLRVRLAKVYSVATFYKAFSLEPRGKHIVKVCTGTACHVRGAPGIIDEVHKLLGVGPGQTTEDMRYTLETVNCVGACGMAPVVIVDDVYHRKVRIEDVAELLETDDGEADE